MTQRLTVASVLLAAGVAGLFFVPVFGVTALLAPIFVPLALAFGVAELCTRREALVAWRPVLFLGVGGLGIVETVLFSTTAAGIPTGETFTALASGAAGSWQLVLQSTWPARPEPSLLLFVPLLVLLAGMFGVELLRLRRPVLALVPSFAVIVVSQCYSALSGTGALVGGLAYAAVAGVLFTSVPPDAAQQRREGPSFPAVGLALPSVALALAGAVVAGLLLPSAGPAYSLKQDQITGLDARVASPLNDIAYRLEHPGTQVFAVRGAAGVDRWPLVVLDGFDGVNWTPGSRYRRLGTELVANPLATVPFQRRTATIAVGGLSGPWLPSQPSPASVLGADPLVEESQGTLWLQRPANTATEYTLSWWEPEIRPADLLDAAIDQHAPGGLGGIGDVPAEVGRLAQDAVGGLRPSFRTALALERYLRDNYRLATGADLPSGHSWPQLRKFLFETRRGTSEQFASAYVTLARAVGLPARLVVGFRTPTGVPDSGYAVRNEDVLAWPEVAVAGVGWVPLDPARAAAASSGTGATGLAAVTEKARDQLPPPQQMQDPPLPGGTGSAGEQGTGDGWSFPVAVVVAVTAALGLLWLAGVPLAKRVRSWRRRRRAGTGAVLGAWLEVRDRLREHRVPLAAGMTVRDLSAAARGIGDESTVDGLHRLATIVDWALWSGGESDEQAGPQAWSAVWQVRRGLAGRGPRARIRAALDPRTILPSWK